MDKNEKLKSLTNATIVSTISWFYARISVSFGFSYEKFPNMVHKIR